MIQNSINLETAPFGLPVADASGSALSSVTLSDGEVLIGSTGNAPVAATLTAGTNVTITNGPGSIEIEASSAQGAMVYSAINTVTFTSSGTYTPPAGLQFIMLEAVGAGGRAQQLSGSDAIGLCASGSSAGYFLGFRTAAQIGASATVTIGASGGSQSGNTTFVSSAGTLTAPGAFQGTAIVDVVRLSAVGTRAAGSESISTAWRIYSRALGGGSPCLIYEGATHLKGLLGGGGPSLGPGQPHRFILGPANTNQSFSVGAGVGFGSGAGATAIRRDSGSATEAEVLGQNGVVYITEFVV